METEKADSVLQAPVFRAARRDSVHKAGRYGTTGTFGLKRLLLMCTRAIFFLLMFTFHISAIFLNECKYHNRKDRVVYKGGA